MSLVAVSGVRSTGLLNSWSFLAFHSKCPTHADDSCRTFLSTWQDFTRRSVERWADWTKGTVWPCCSLPQGCTPVGRCPLWATSSSLLPSHPSAPFTLAAEIPPKKPLMALRQVEMPSPSLPLRFPSVHLPLCSSHRQQSPARSSTTLPLLSVELECLTGRHRQTTGTVSCLRFSLFLLG